MTAVRSALVATILAWMVVAAAGCDTATSTYFTTGSRTAVSVPIDVAQPVYFGIDLLVPQDHDRVQLLDLVADDQQGGVDVEGLAAGLGPDDPWIGTGTATDVANAGIDLSTYVPLAGYTFNE